MADKNIDIESLRALKTKLIDLENSTRDQLSLINRTISDLLILGQWEGNDFYHFEDMFGYAKKGLDVQLNSISDEIIPYLEKKILEAEDY